MIGRVSPLCAGDPTAEQVEISADKTLQELLDELCAMEDLKLSHSRWGGKTVFRAMRFFVRTLIENTTRKF